MSGVTQRTVYRLREQVDRKLARLPLRTFDTRPRGDLLSRVTNDIDNIGQSLQQSLTQLITSLLTIVGVLIMMLTDQPDPGARVAARGARLVRGHDPHHPPLAEACSSPSGRPRAPSTATSRRCTPGHSIVKAFGRQRQAIAQFDRENEQLYEASYRAQSISGVIQPAMNFIANLNYVAIAVIGGLRVAAGQMTPGRCRGVHPVLAPVHVPDHPGRLDRQRPAVGGGIRGARVRAAGRGRGDAPTRRTRPAWSGARGAVAFEDVSFRYEPDRPLIDDLTSTSTPGETIAIVGPTGAGKTTLVNLLMRFYEVDAGRITVDGIDTRELPRDELRRQFGMVLQDTWLFHGTIRENIAYGREAATEERDRRRGRGRPRRPLRPDAARRLRHRHRRRRDQRLGRREAAADDRPRVPRRPADPHPRRGDVLGRHAHRGPHPARDGVADARPDDVRDRAPAVDDPRRGHDPRDGPRPDRRAGHARGAARAAAASTPTCTRASSASRSPRRSDDARG